MASSRSNKRESIAEAIAKVIVRNPKTIPNVSIERSQSVYEERHF
jgi:hypothetical protein